MRKSWSLLIMVIIFGGLAAMEIYDYFIFLQTSYEPRELPTLEVGRREFSIFKDNELVGSYIFWVDGVGEYKGQTAYFTHAQTSVAYKNKTLDLRTAYVFNDKLNPLDYSLNATVDGEGQTLVAVFNGWNVSIAITEMNNTINKSIELPVNSVLIDNNNFGHWDLFLRSFDLVSGRRIAFTAFVPQYLDKIEDEIVVDSDVKTITISGIDYACTVARTTKQDLVFYIYRGSLVRLDEPNQNMSIYAVQ
jgi:hypothetical protein